MEGQDHYGNYYPGDGEQQQWDDQGDYDGSQEYYYDESNSYQQYEEYYQDDRNQEYYPEQQQSYEHQAYEDQYSSSLFYPINPPLVVHNYGFDTQGDPISAIATSEACDTKLMFIASHTASDQKRTIMKGSKSFRGSRMTVLYENDAPAAGVEKRNIYSSFVAHPEATEEGLNKLHSQLFGDGTIPTSTFASNIASQNKPRPPSSYGPPFGPPYLVSKAIYNPQISRAEEKHCMGITSILPHGDRVCTISPYGVRIHTRGGMVLSDKNELEGSTCGCVVGEGFVLTGGMPGSSGRNVHCLDLKKDLRVVSSHALLVDSSTSSGKCIVTVADMAMNHDRNTIVAGCTDGTIRLLDGERRMMEVAKAKAQRGGVAHVAVHENLICATGYSSTGVTSASSPVPYPFPSHVLIYDVRYLGRGGIPHMSASLSGPRFATFLPRGCIPGIEGEDPFLLVGSGQTFGGFELIKPFETGGVTSFFQPELAPGESVTTMLFEDDGELTIGTSYGRVLQYGLSNYEKTIVRREASGSIGSIRSFDGESFSGCGRMRKSKEPLDMPPYVPLPPELSIDPRALMDGNNKGFNVFDSYIMASSPMMSEENMQLHTYFATGQTNMTTLGPMVGRPLVPPSKRWLSTKVLAEGESMDGMHTTKTDLLAVHVNISEDSNEGKSRSRDDQTFLNPNKLLYSKLHSEFYDADADPRKNKIDSRESEAVGEEDMINDEANGIPQRYKLDNSTARRGVDASYNDTGVWVGWDYNLSWANSWANSVLTLLFFMREIRSNALQLQLHHSTPLLSQSGKYSRCLVSVISELGVLFHQIQHAQVNWIIHPDGKMKPFIPSNFISAFTLLPEASNLALLDGVAGSSDLAKRPEAFYRFVVQFLDKELVQLEKPNVIDELQGIDFVSIIEYSSSSTKPKISTNRSMTLDLSYDEKWKGASAARFSDVLRFSLCKETPLRAYSEENRAYEPVIQRKIATRLPAVLALSCCCAGSKDSGLQFWQNKDVQNWLPERIEVQIEADNSITVKELVEDLDGNEEWITSSRKLSLPPYLVEQFPADSSQSLPVRKSYSLDAVLSFVRGSSANSGHHVVHIRAPQGVTKQTLLRQLRKIEECITEEIDTQQQMTLVADITSALKTRKDEVLNKLCDVEERIKNGHNEDSDWLLLNGLRVTKTLVDDARSFGGNFKEPCIVIFREIDEDDSEGVNNESLVSLSAMDTVSLSNGCGPLIDSSGDIPGKGDLIAIDCEFVCVQAEKSHLSSSGAKNVTSEPRNALARISIIDCRTDQVVIDDYVLPNEPVVDCLTRFSGIREDDLDVKNSPHHLVTTREAYLKVRLLMERGCLFVGHGLNQDFRILNISIPPNQIIDTAAIYHQPNQRYISLRFLTNYVLGFDMQREVHDSVEDARGAYELYKKALSLKSEGAFDEFLVKMYAEGNKTQFKLM